MSSKLLFVSQLQSVGFVVIKEGSADITLHQENGKFLISKLECKRHKKENDGKFFSIPHIVIESSGFDLQIGNWRIFVFPRVEVQFRGIIGNLAVNFSKWDDGTMWPIDPGYVGVVSQDDLFKWKGFEDAL